MVSNEIKHLANFVSNSGGLLINSETDEPLIWLGSEPHEHPEIDQFLEALSRIAKSPDIHEIWEELASKLD